MLVIELFPNTLNFRIARQDRIGEDFNPLGKFKDDFEASSGFVIASTVYPDVTEAEIEDRNKINLFVRGSNKLQDLNVLSAPNERWLDAMLTAVREYNAQFGEEEDKPLRLPRI